MFAVALLLLIGVGLTFGLRAANQPRLARFLAFTIGAVFAAFAALIVIGVLFGD